MKSEIISSLDTIGNLEWYDIIHKYYEKQYGKIDKPIDTNFDFNNSQFINNPKFGFMEVFYY